MVTGTSTTPTFVVVPNVSHPPWPASAVAGAQSEIFSSLVTHICTFCNKSLREEDFHGPRPKEVVTGHSNTPEVMSCARKLSASHSEPSKQVSCSPLTLQSLDHRSATLSAFYGISPCREIPRGRLESAAAHKFLVRHGSSQVLLFVRSGAFICQQSSWHMVAAWLLCDSVSQTHAHSTKSSLPPARSPLLNSDHNGRLSSPRKTFLSRYRSKYGKL